MAVVTGTGLGNTSVQQIFAPGAQFYAYSSTLDTSFTVTSVVGLGSVTVNGSGFVYTSSVINGQTYYQLTGGTITSVSFTNGPSNQTWTGLSVSAAAAFNALLDPNTFNNLFFNGNDIFTWTPAATSNGTVLGGYDGDDTFNVSNWTFAIGGIDGGNGNDTVNVADGLGLNINYNNSPTDLFLNQNSANFHITNVETLNLGAGFNYTILAQSDIVTSGHTLKVDGSQLGASNRLVFDTNVTFFGDAITGDLILLGGAGDDVLEGGMGANTFNGGAGNDTVEFFWSQRNVNHPTGVTADLSISSVQNFGTNWGTGSFISIENLVGSGLDDTLTGNANDNLFTGMGGNDRLEGGGGNDTAIYSGASSNYTIHYSGTTANTGHTVTISGPDGTDTLTNIEYARFSDQTMQLFGPVMTTASQRVAANQTFALSSLFSATTPDGDAITGYQLWDSSTDPNSGHFIINGQAQPARTILNITAAQLSQVSFVTGTVSDNLQIRAFDGGWWSAADNAAWAPFTIGPTYDRAPVLLTHTLSMTHLQTVSLSNLLNQQFTLVDADGDTMTRYQLWDGTTDPNSGHFVVNGQVQAARTVIDISAADLANTSFVTGMVSDNIEIRAFDGFQWSAADNAAWSPFTIGVWPNRPPTVSPTGLMTVNQNQSVPLQSFLGWFSVQDPDQDPITRYQLWDSTRDPNSGNWVVNGQVQAPGTVVDVSAAQLAQTSFVGGSVIDHLEMRVFDGFVWSAPDSGPWAQFSAGPPPNSPPTVLTNSMSVAVNQTLSLSSLMVVIDSDNDPITAYQLWDSTSDPNSGHFVINGQAQLARTVIDVSAAQLSQTSFVTGTVADSLQIRASDGKSWSAADNAAWSPFTLTPPPNHAPQLTTQPVTAVTGDTIALSNLFQVTDADGDAMTQYQLWDSTNAANSGHFVINNVAQAARTVITVSAAQLSQTSFVAGAVGDTLQIRAFDGISWSAADNAAWAPFTVSIAANHAPVLTTSNKNPASGASLALSSLFSVSDADGDTMTQYQLWDSTRDSNSGHFVINNVAQPAGTVITVSAAQLAQTSFLVGTVADSLQIRAYDGKDWSAADNAVWAPFTVTPVVDHPPQVNAGWYMTSANQTIPLSNMFSVGDADGDAITKYQLWESSRDPNSGHFEINGVAQAAGTVIDITAAQLAQTTFVTGIYNADLEVRAFDGQVWSAPDNATWGQIKTVVDLYAPNMDLIGTVPYPFAPHHQTYALSSLLSANTGGGNPVIAYQVQYSGGYSGSGYLLVNGVVQPAGTVIDLTPAQWAQTSFVTASIPPFQMGNINNLQVRASDGSWWSSWNSSVFFSVLPNTLPQLSTFDIAATPGQTLALSNLFNVTDADGDSMTRYQLWDSTTNPSSGHWTVNGVAQAAGTVIDITAAQAAQTFFVAGSSGISDGLQIRAFDGLSWSAADTAAWAPFHVTAT